MNIKPARNWILTNWIERNYEMKGSLFVSSVSTAFMNRHRVFAVGELDEDKTQVKPGDIVVVSRMARELSVVGQTKNSEGEDVQVAFIPVDQVVGILEGDEAVDAKVKTESAIVVPPLVVPPTGGDIN